MRFPRFLALVLSATAIFAADPALLNLVMPEARVVAGIDVEKARDSFLGQKLLAEMSKKEGELAKFTQMTGFDPRRDLKEIVIASSDANTKNPPALVVVRGTFDTGKIRAFLTTTGLAAAENIGGVDYFQKAGAEEMGMAFLSDSVAIAGSPAIVRSALSRRSATASALAADTTAKVQSFSQGNDIWMVTSIPVADLSNAIPGTSKGGGPAGMMQGDAFKGIEQMAFGLRFGATTMDLTAETVSRSQKDATGLADVVRFLSTMVQMNREKPEVKGLATALDAMSLTTNDRTTRLTISLPVTEIEKAFQSGRPASKI